MDTFRPRHILAATDGSPRSLLGVIAAADLAVKSGARLTIVTCSPPLPERSGDQRPQLHVDLAQAAAAHEAREWLRDAEALARSHGVMPSLEHVAAAQPYEGILATARERGCDLVVIASRGRGRAVGLLLGSQTLGLLAHSPLPVLVCPEGEAPSWRHILVPIDGSAASESAMPVAADLARLHDGRLTLLMCSPALTSGGEPGGMDRKEYEILVGRGAAESLTSAAAIARREGVAATCEHAFAAAPWRSIVDTAESIGAGVICMASRRRSGRLAATIASETLKVLTHARVAVLVCRTPGDAWGHEEVPAVQAA